MMIGVWLFSGAVAAIIMVFVWIFLDQSIYWDTPEGARIGFTLGVTTIILFILGPFGVLLAVVGIFLALGSVGVRKLYELFNLGFRSGK